MFDFFKKIFGKSKKDTGNKRVKPIDIEVNERVNLHKGEEIPKIWHGVIHSVADETFSVDIPELMGEFPFPFREKKEVLVTIPKGKKVARFTTKLIKIAWKSKPPILVLEYPTSVDWEESRERKHVRIATNIPAKVKRDTPHEKSWEMVRVVDFSITGLSFVSTTPYKKGEQLQVKLMSMQFPLKPRGVVARTHKLQERSEEGKPNYNIGIRFVDVNEMDKQMFSNFSFYLSRMNRT